MHPVVNLQGAFIRHTDLSNSDLRHADLSRVDASGAVFRNSDFLDARLSGAILRGADLTDAQNLTEAQLATAILDEHTRLPAYIDRRTLNGQSREAMGVEL
ncbi:pentapeptide repeat-containing protein [Methylobacterium brachiatum]|uniref:pentapeptide repeat-containing protein n=1 Tax=Methylobacterium brachiatum TaxID=269660 RepID=UPI001FCDD333|nr:pentapeptide repeat-containing protein [Methylobacterium brachiatum]